MEVDIVYDASKDEDFLRSLDDMTAVMEPIKDHMSIVFQENFSSESGGGEKWTELAPATIADRIRRGYGEGPILQRSGALVVSGISLQRTEPHAAEVGFDGGNPYAATHQFGSSNGHIPARPFLVLSPAAIGEIEEMILRYLGEHHG